LDHTAFDTPKNSDHDIEPWLYVARSRFPSFIMVYNFGVQMYCL
jgi:hypothetical protein